MSLTDDDVQRLVEGARDARGRAHAPYSEYRVGAAVLTDDGHVFTGCNVENASLGLTMCAERVAIFRAAAELGPEVRIAGLIALNEEETACAPCGACRQVLAEFGPEAEVVFVGEDGLTRRSLAQLLPDVFSLPE